MTYGPIRGSGGGGAIPPGTVFENRVLLGQDDLRSWDTKHFELIPPTGDENVHNICQGIVLERRDANGISGQGQLGGTSVSNTRSPWVLFVYEPDKKVDVPANLQADVIDGYGWHDRPNTNDFSGPRYESLTNNRLDIFNLGNIVASSDYDVRLTYDQSNLSIAHYGLYAKGYFLEPQNGNSRARGKLNPLVEGELRFIVWYSRLTVSPE